MKLAIIPILLAAVSGTVFASEAEKPAPQGFVTIQELPLMVVEAKRWSAADEQALQAAQAKLARQTNDSRAVAYVAR